jgi:acyl-CoA hydrolase
VVTLSVDQVLFKEPIKVGEMVTFLASVNYVGRTSMEVGIKVVAEDIQNRCVRHTNSCYFTMVAMADGVPQVVPELIIENEEQAKRQREGMIRKQMRAQLTQQTCA